MDKFDVFEDFKGKVFKNVEQKEAIPEEIYKIINNMLNNMAQVYKDNHCNTNSITEYIKETEGEIMTELGEIGENRKNNEFQEILIVVNTIEKDIEDRIDYFQTKEGQNKAINGFEEMNLGDSRFSEIITNTLIDRLKDIQSRQSRILFSLGYSYSRIEEINDRVNGFINNAVNQEKIIYDIIQKDSNELINDVKGMYEEYIQYSKQNENNKEELNETNGQTRKEEFRERINSGLSLKEQSEYVEEFKRKENEKKEEQKETNSCEALPSDIIF